jgi:anti-sigma regulatory factor (Ser/Thr protein kinase)
LPNPILEKQFKITPRDFMRAGEVSIKVQSMLKSIGFSPEIIRRVSICAYESEMNAVMYGGEGLLLLTVNAEEIKIDVIDDGPGIPDIELALQEGFSTAPPEYREMGFGAGMGLPNITRNADRFEIRSQKGQGTHLNIGFKVNRD